METKMAYLGDSSLCEDGISPWAGNFPYKHKNPPSPVGSVLLPAQLKQIYGCE